MDLFADDEGQTSHPLQINESYANRFQHNKERAELHRLEEKYGKAAADILAGKRGTDEFDGSDSDDSSDDESEDEEGEQVTAEVDAAILRTLAKIRQGDASIYDSSKKVFDEEKALAASSALLPRATREKLGKRVTLADYQRERLRDLMNTADDPALALAEATTSTTREDERVQDKGWQQLSHVQEQEQLRKQVTRAFHDMDGEGDEGDIFTKRDADAQDDADPAAYRKYLLDTLGENEGVVREALRAGEQGEENMGSPAPTTSAPTKRKRKSSTRDNAAENEEFLLNYILNRGWMENPQGAPRPSSSRRAVKQEEQDSDDDMVQPQPTTRDWEAEAADLDAASDASFDSRAEAFEQAFNFRYEAMEAGKASDQVQSYARQNTTSVRRTEDKRKQEREERRRRKDAEKRSKMEEIDRMRELRKGTLRDKLKQLREAAGSEKLDIDLSGLEGDFDEEQHERMMAAFGEDYYGEDDEGKPVWDDDVDIGDILAEERDEEEQEQEVQPAKMSKNQRKKEARRLAAAEEGGGDDEDVDMDDGEQADDDVKLSKKDRKKLKKALKKAASKGDDTAPSTSSTSTPTPAMTSSERLETARALAAEYRSLDYEDVIGDLPTRFHYTPVAKTDYGLTPIEILMADDKDLNEVVGLKYFQPYRRGGKRPKEMSRKLREFRRKLEEREVGKKEAWRAERERRKESGEEVGQEKKRKGRKERQREKAAARAAEGGDGEAGVKVEGQGESVTAAPAPAPATDSTHAADTPASASAKDLARREKKERNRANKKVKVEQAGDE